MGLLVRADSELHPSIAGGADSADELAQGLC